MHVFLGWITVSISDYGRNYHFIDRYILLYELMYPLSEYSIVLFLKNGFCGIDTSPRNLLDRFRYN